MKGSDFIFDSVFYLLYYNCHKTNLNRAGSYKDFSEWKKTKQQQKKSVNDDDKYFHYAATVILNHEKFGKHPQINSQITSFLYKYN